MTTKFPLLLLSLALTGCAAKYAGPTGPGTATAYIGPDWSGRGAYSVAFLQDGKFVAVEGEVLTSMKGGKPYTLSDVNTTIPAGKPFTFKLLSSVNLGSVTQSCAPIRTFCPRPGAHYELRMDMYERDGRPMCGTSVDEIENRGTTSERKTRLKIETQPSC